VIDSQLLVNPQIPMPDHPDVVNPVLLSIGTLYHFQKAGVVLAKHEHTTRNNHSTVVLSGRLEVVEGEARRVISAGDIVFLQPGVPYEFRALEPAAILNLARLNATAESVREEFAQLAAQAQTLQQALDAARSGLDEFMAVVNG
jgi:mannose-6-phosphate isomerase-like protein (cupin superfamily)